MHAERFTVTTRRSDRSNWWGFYAGVKSKSKYVSTAKTSMHMVKSVLLIYLLMPVVICLDALMKDAMKSLLHEPLPSCYEMAIRKFHFGPCRAQDKDDFSALFMITKEQQSSLVNLPFPPLMENGTCAPSTATYPPKYACVDHSRIDDYQDNTGWTWRYYRLHRQRCRNGQCVNLEFPFYQSYFITAEYNIPDASFTSNSWMITGEGDWSAAMARVDGNNAPPCMYLSNYGNAAEWLKIDLLHKYVVYGYYNTRCTFWWNLCISLDLYTSPDGVIYDLILDDSTIPYVGLLDGTVWFDNTVSARYWKFICVDWDRRGEWSPQLKVDLLGHA